MMTKDQIRQVLEAFSVTLGDQSREQMILHRKAIAILQSALDEPDEAACCVDTFSSRLCELGSRVCNTKHPAAKQTPLTADRINEMWAQAIYVADPTAGNAHLKLVRLAEAAHKIGVQE